MSIKYKDKLISALSDQIDNKTPSVDKVYSSAYIQSLIALANQHIKNVGEIKPSVKGVVGTKAELDGYDKARLQDKDIIYVLADETHNGYTAYWRYDLNTDSFNYIGSLSPYYSPTEIDAFINAKQEKLVSGVNIKTVGGKSLVGEGDLDVGYTLETLYPVGSVYTTVDDNFDPNASFGGVWSQVDNGDFLFGTGESEYDYDFSLNKRGGQSTVTINVEQMPSHDHTAYGHTHSITTNGVQSSTTATITGTVFAIPAIASIGFRNNDGEYDDFQLGTANWVTKHTWTDTDWIPVNNRATVSMASAFSYLRNTGGGAAHNNIPAYYTVHYWYRTS